MKILALAPWVPSRRRPRSLGLLSMLASVHNIHLVATCWDEADVADLAALPYGTTGVRLNHWPAVARTGLGVLRGMSLQQAYMNDRKFRRRVQQIETAFAPDLLYFNTLRSAQWKGATSTRSSIIDLDEFRSKYYEQVAKTGGTAIGRSIARVEGPLMRRAESKILAQFDHILVSSPTDLSTHDPKVSLVRSPEALSFSGSSEPAKNEETFDLVFVGRMNYSANVEAIVSFVEDVMPSLWQRLPAARIAIVGDAPDRRVLALANDRVVVTGRVDSVSEYYRSARVSVIPVTQATGVQMKLIESLRCGIPVVCSPIVAWQAGVAAGEEVLTATTTDEWADSISRLLTDTTVAHRIATAGADWAELNYSRAGIQQQLFSALERAVP